MRKLRTTAVAAAAAAAVVAPGIASAAAPAGFVGPKPPAYDPAYRGFIVSFHTEGLTDAQVDATAGRLMAKAQAAGISTRAGYGHIVVNTQSYRAVSSIYRFDPSVVAIEENYLLHIM